MSKENELRIVKNFLALMPKSYRQRHQNWFVVQSILIRGTDMAGSTSSIEKCRELGIDPDGYTLD